MVRRLVVQFIMVSSILFFWAFWFQATGNLILLKYLKNHFLFLFHEGTLCVYNSHKMMFTELFFFFHDTSSCLIFVSISHIRFAKTNTIGDISFPQLIVLFERIPKQPSNRIVLELLPFSSL